jgi:hypothetical protein
MMSPTRTGPAWAATRHSTGPDPCLVAELDRWLRNRCALDESTDIPQPIPARCRSLRAA